MTARGFAADDFDIIRSRVEEIAQARRPFCPVNGSRLLYDCLRSSARCPEGCPYVGDWLGPAGIGPLPLVGAAA
jgi:hypothetical protein